LLLGDGLIGQMMEPVEFPDHLKSKPTNKDEWATNGMDTRGSNKRNLVKSLFLDAGELNEHNLMLKAKYDRMKQGETRYESYNIESDYKTLIVSYGTMSRVCKTAIDNMKDEGIEVGMIRPQTLFPFPEKAVYEAASKESCKIVVSIEMSMGQMVEDVERSVKGKIPVRWYGKCGGDVPTPEEVVEAVKSF
jgi:2-oxoglutarate ferredoxin oxidoreductase subunit alpha